MTASCLIPALHLCVQVDPSIRPRRPGAPAGFLMVAVLDKPSALWGCSPCRIFCSCVWSRCLSKAIGQPRARTPCIPGLGFFLHPAVYDFARQKHSSAKSPGGATLAEISPLAGGERKHPAHYVFSGASETALQVRGNLRDTPCPKKRWGGLCFGLFLSS